MTPWSTGPATWPSAARWRSRSSGRRPGRARALRPRDRDHRRPRPPAPQHRDRAGHGHHPLGSPGHRHGLLRARHPARPAAQPRPAAGRRGGRAGRVVLADALAFAHAHGVLHRDVKPQNVLVLPTSWVLADFGIARLVDSEHTASAETFTYRHASPQMLDGAPPTAADDLWSLGSTLYTLLDGRPAVRQRRPRRRLRAGLPAPGPHRAAPPPRTAPAPPPAGGRHRPLPGQGRRGALGGAAELRDALAGAADDELGARASRRPPLTPRAAGHRTPSAPAGRRRPRRRPRCAPPHARSRAARRRAGAGRPLGAGPRAAPARRGPDRHPPTGPAARPRRERPARPAGRRRPAPRHPAPSRSAADACSSAWRRARGAARRRPRPGRSRAARRRRRPGRPATAAEDRRAGRADAHARAARERPAAARGRRPALAFDFLDIRSDGVTICAVVERPDRGRGPVRALQTSPGAASAPTFPAGTTRPSCRSRCRRARAPASAHRRSLPDGGLGIAADPRCVARRRVSSRAQLAAQHPRVEPPPPAPPRRQRAPHGPSYGAHASARRLGWGRRRPAPKAARSARSATAAGPPGAESARSASSATSVARRAGRAAGRPARARRATSAQAPARRGAGAARCASARSAAGRAAGPAPAPSAATPRRTPEGCPVGRGRARPPSVVAGLRGGVVAPRTVPRWRPAAGAGVGRRRDAGRPSSKVSSFGVGVNGTQPSRSK